MAKASIENTLKEVNELVSHFIKMPETKMWIDMIKRQMFFISASGGPKRQQIQKCWKMGYC